MKIEISGIDPTQFMVHQHVVNGEVLHLVQPNHIGTKFTRNNAHLRSSVWNDNGEAVSLSFGKFVNWGENPDNFPVPTDLKKCVFVQKVDGSTLILSRYKGNYIIRTRGTLDASLMEKNGNEVEIFKSAIIPSIPDKSETWNYSIIFEWVSPLNRVVLLYPEPKWYLIGIVNHEDYSLMPQHELDTYASQMKWERPPIYSFDNVNSFEELIVTVEAWKGVEGIVVYSNNGQMLHKVKGLDYLARHRLKSELASFEKLVDFWFAVGQPIDFQMFWNEVEKLTDYETAHEHFGDLSRIIDAWKNVQKIVSGMKEFVENTLQPLPTRRDQAVAVFSSYGKTERTNCLFTLLDGKELSDNQYKHLLYQCLKK
jgi:hypothetical protein